MRYKLFILSFILILIFFGMSISLGTPHFSQGIIIKYSYAQEKPVSPEKPTSKEFPDGLVGHRYNFVITPGDFVSPYKITLISGTLPPGLTVNELIGGIEGEPTQAGKWEFILRVVDANGKEESFSGGIQVWNRVLTVGEKGTFKGFDGLQMAINMARDMDEIRIERGTYIGSGLVIPENKVWEYGIKISGGWDETFSEKDNNPETTILDGNEEENRILTISNAKGTVFIENLTFRNSKGGAVSGGGTFTNCTFTNNSASDEGGAVSGGGTFTNCTFTNNSTSEYPSSGGAVYGDGTFTNCTFINNSARSGGTGGAVSGGGTFTNCTFTNNSAGEYGSSGGAVYGGYGIFTNCTFTNNSAGKDGNGGAVYGGHGIFTNCTFTNNSGGCFGGAVHGGGGIFTNCIFTNNDAESGGAVCGGGRDQVVLHGGDGTFINCAFANNSARWGGAFSGKKGTFINCLFANNSAREEGGVFSNRYQVWALIYDDGKGFFINCTFYGNKAKGDGGAIKGEGEIINCTFYGNKAEGDGGAIKGEGEILNSIFYNNTAQGKLNDITSTGNTVIDYSLINYIKGGVDFREHNIMGDPKFTDADKGDFSLRPDSPCINAGKVPQGFDVGSLDIAGKPRIVGGEIDMGAYEFQGK